MDNKSIIERNNSHGGSPSSLSPTLQFAPTVLKESGYQEVNNLCPETPQCTVGNTPDDISKHLIVTTAPVFYDAIAV